MTLIVSNETRPVGRITLQDGTLTATNTGTRRLAEHALLKAGGDAALAYRALASLSNGYLSVSEEPDSGTPAVPGPAREFSGTITSQVLNLGWRYDPLERRNKHGEWTRGGSGDGMNWAKDGAGYEHPPADRVNMQHHKASDHPFVKKYGLSSANIVSAYNAATPGEKEQGARWYADAHDVALAIGKGDAVKGAAMLSAFSPQTDWATDVMNAASTLANGKVPAHGVGITGAVRTRATAILNAGSDDEIEKLFPAAGSAKTRNFYKLIANGGDHPGDSEGMVVIDRHALSVAAGRRLTKQETEAPTYAEIKEDHPDWTPAQAKAYRATFPADPTGSVFTYQHISDLYREAAKQISDREGVQVSPHQVQAATWLHQLASNDEDDSHLVELAAEAVRHGLKMTSVPGASTAKGRASAMAKRWKTWDAYAEAHHIPVHVGTTAMTAEELLALELAGASLAGGITAQILGLGWQDEHRDSKGRWTRFGGVGDAVSVMEREREGFSVSPRTGEAPSGGYMVALDGHTHRYPAEILDDPGKLHRAIDDMLMSERESFQGHDMFLGGWVEDGKLWLDPSQNVQDQAEAERLGRERDQVGIFDLNTFNTINTGGSGGGRIIDHANPQGSRGYPGGLLGPARGSAAGRGGEDRRRDQGWPAPPGAGGRRYLAGPPLELSAAAIGLAWKDAWEHELRGPGGKWAKSDYTAVIAKLDGLSRGDDTDPDMQPALAVAAKALKDGDADRAITTLQNTARYFGSDGDRGKLLRGLADDIRTSREARLPVRGKDGTLAKPVAYVGPDPESLETGQVQVIDPGKMDETGDVLGSIVTVTGGSKPGWVHVTYPDKTEDDVPAVFPDQAIATQPPHMEYVTPPAPGIGGGPATVPARDSEHLDASELTAMIYDGAGSQDPDTLAPSLKRQVASDLADEMQGTGTSDMLTSVGVDSASEDSAISHWEDPDWSFYQPSDTTMSIIGTTNAKIASDYGDTKAWAWDHTIIHGGTPEAEHLARQYAAGKLVQQWAMTSNDHSPVSLAIQHAAEDEFGLNEVTLNDWDEGNEEFSTGQKVAQYGPVYRAFLRAQYNLTQKQLKARGISSVHLYRGMHWDEPGTMPSWADDVRAAHKTIEAGDIPAPRPLSSWSATRQTADQFALGGEDDTSGYGLTLESKIPAERILSYPRTGVGSLNESEFVVIAPEGKARVYPMTLTGWEGEDWANQDVQAAMTLNEDWIKALHWDLPTDVGELAATLSADELRRLPTLPAWRAAPATLKRNLPVRLGTDLSGDISGQFTDLAGEQAELRDARGRWTRDPASYVHGMGGGRKVYRGVTGDAEGSAQATRNGQMGQGMFGASIYTATDPAGAVGYAQATPTDKTGLVLRGTLSPDAKVAKKVPRKYKGTPADYARENGYDAVETPGMVQIVNPDAIAWDPKSYTAMEASTGYNPQPGGGRGLYDIELAGGWRDAWRHEVRGRHGEWTRNPGGVPVGDDGLSPRFGLRRDKAAASRKDEAAAVGQFMEHADDGVPGLFGHGSQLDWDHRPPTIYPDSKHPGYLAFIDWDGHINFSQATANGIRDGLQGNGPIEDPDAFSVPLHELIHAVIPPGERRMNNGDMEAYQKPAGQAIEEGFTQLATADHAAEFFDGIGVGGRETPNVKEGALGTLQNDPKWERGVSQFADDLQAKVAELDAGTTPSHQQAASHLREMVQDLKDNPDDVNYSTFDDSFSGALSEVQHLGDPALAQWAMAMKERGKALQGAQQYRRDTMSEYARRMADPDRIEAGTSWGHYDEWTKDAYEWTAEISRRMNGSADPGMVVKLADQVSAVGTAAKSQVMAEQLLAASGIHDLSRAEMAEALKTAEDQILASWGKNAAAAVADQATAKMRGALAAMRVEAEAA